MSSALAKTPTTRDLRIDMIRGLALVMIFINHVPGTAYERLTSRNFGYSDAAEAFVLLAGISAALAYGKALAPGISWAAVSRPWARAWTLYLVHLMLSLLVLGIVAALARFGGNPQMMLQDNIGPLLRDPTGVLIGLPLLLHQFGYVNILPLYILLLLMAPGAIWLGQRRPGLLLAGSALVWLAAGLSFTNLRTWPGGNGWFLNPLSWQLIFVIGLLVGLRLRAGQRLVPLHPRLVGLALAYVTLAALHVQVPAIGAAVRGITGWLYEQGLPALSVGFDKGYVQLPRLLHLLALAYLASCLPMVRSAAASPQGAVLGLLGRHALPVFALGTVLAFAARALRLALTDAGHPPGLAGDTLIIGGAILLLWGLAALREWLRAPAAAPLATAPRAAILPGLKTHP